MFLRIAGWLVLSIGIVAVIEYVAHRYFMHRPMLDRLGLKGVFHNHAVVHHKHNRLDVNVDLPVKTHFLWGAPLLLLVGACDWMGAVVLASCFVLHAVTWTSLHRAIHDLEENWTRKVPWFSRWKRHHEVHHQHPSRNFGAVFIFTDYLFGTAARKGE